VKKGEFYCFLGIESETQERFEAKRFNSVSIRSESAIASLARFFESNKISS